MSNDNEMYDYIGEESNAVSLKNAALNGDDEFVYGDNGNNEMYNGGNDDDEAEVYSDEEVQLPGVDDLPLFANPEARKVDLDIKEKEKRIEITANEQNDMKERVMVMKEHFKNVQSELDHTNTLYTAKFAEITTEKHLRQLSSRALGRSQVDSKKIQAEIERTQDQLSLLQSQVYKANEKMDEFKMTMNWNQEELEQWAVAAKQKDEDSLALQKYTRMDELKIKELSMQLEYLTKEALKRKEALESEATETQAKQVELDRIEVEFKILHVERQTLVKQWQDTIEEMKRRDLEINELGERFAVAKIERTKKEQSVATQQKRLSTQVLENKEVEARSETLSRIVSRKREEMLIGTQKQQEFRDELESLKNELTTAAENLITKRNSNNNTANAMEEKRVLLERERQKYALVKKKHDDAKNSNLKAEELAKLAEDDLSQSERDFASQMAKVKSLKDKLLKESQQVFESKKEEARYRSEIIGSKTTCRNMETQLLTLDKESARQQELLYNAEFQIQHIERKIARGMGERSDDEKRQLKQAIEIAEQKKEATKEKKKMLLTQSRKLANEHANSRNRRDGLAAAKLVLIEKQAELELENRCIEDEFKRDNKGKEELTIQNDLLRLEVRRLRDLLSAKADAVFSLENRRQQLQLSMEERKQEISVHKDVLRAELKSLNDDKHKLTMELRDREAQVEKLRSRFESVARTADEGHSQSYFIIQAAQKREELQRKGNELDQDVRKCEREIRALQTTLDHLNARNMAYRASFQKIDLKGEDADVLKQLEDRAKVAKEAVFRKKKELQRIITDFEEDSRRLEQVKLQNKRVQAQREHLESARSQVEEELFVQQTQMNELGGRIEKVILKHRTKMCELTGTQMSTFQNGTLEEKASKAEVLKDVVQNVLYTLGQLASEFPEVSDQMSLKLKEADLRMPTKPPTRGGVTGSRGGTGGGLSGTSQSGSTASNSNGRNGIQPTNFNMDL